MWVSPDGKIHKVIILEGRWFKKPSEQTECRVLVTDCPDTLSKYNNSILIIGDSDNYIRRMLDLCLITMNEQEVAKFTIPPENQKQIGEKIEFKIKLVRINFKGYIYQWNAKKKFEIAKNQKEKGVKLFQEDGFKDGAYCFVKALKIISSIPIDVEAPPETIDSVPLTEINKLKANLYNNLASYYLKNEAWSLVIDTCKKVFIYDEDNVKAHYKIAVAYMKERSFEEAEKQFNYVLVFEPENKAAISRLKYVKEQIRDSNNRFNSLIRNMFQ